jgi:hypothetical protein
MGIASAESGGHPMLYKNLGGNKFKDVTKEMGLDKVGWQPDAAFVDLNEDGYPDVYMLNMAGDNHYFENQGGKGFLDKTRTYFPRTSNGAMGVKYFDFNQDGRLDLYITDMHSDMSPLQVKASDKNFRLDFEKSKSEGWCSPDYSPEEWQNKTNRLIFGNALYLRNAQGGFDEVSEKANAETFWPWGPSVGDLNADGYDDAFITSGMGFPLRYSINNVLLNDGGKRFVDAEFLVGVEPRPSVEQDFFTLDCSGEDKGNKLCYHKTGMLTVRGVASSRGSIITDIDGDGDLDIITSEYNDIPQVFISNLTEKRKIHFLKIKLTGTKSNRDALGATVRVKAGGRTFTQYNDGKSGYLSQSSLPLYFGLADAMSVDAVEVTWPSGQKQTVSSGVTINQQLAITEPRQ